MNDKNKLINLLNDFGVKWKLSDDTSGEGSSESIQIDANDHIGYSGFCCNFYFNDKGDFVTVGVWEE